MYNWFGDRMGKLKEYRKKFGYNYQDMADFLKITKSFYWQIENNQRRLSYKMAVKIAEIFKTKPDKIFYDDFKSLD